MTIACVPGVAIHGPVSQEHAARVLTPEAQAFVAALQRCFDARRRQLLGARDVRQKALDAGQMPDFLPETRAVRDGVWKAAPPAPGLVDRRVEITGPPVPRKMVINALNSGAAVYMSDFEDSHAPTWVGNLDGQVNMQEAVRGAIAMQDARTGKFYRLRTDRRPATLMVRPRGWHMHEAHFLVDGSPCSASLFDFGLFFFHNAKASVAAGAGPYFYLPKMESHLEARLWNDVFNMAQDLIGLPRGTIRATVLIETILAAFEMDEIIYELREHSAGLNCGRWDYIFSFIKRMRNHPQFVLPDRTAVGMTSPFMNAYVQLLIKTCHRRGVHAMGGMAAQIPIKDNAAAHAAAITKVRADKLREVTAGHDGTWVAHPDLVTVALEIFNQHMPQPNQLYVRNDDVVVTAENLLSVKGLTGAITEAGIRDNIDVGLQYMEAWLRGVGCVPIHNLMEDAATAEISRSQLWQWVRHNARTAEGKEVTAAWVEQLLKQDLDAKRTALGEKRFAASKFDLAGKLFASTVLGGAYSDFLTTLCYDYIVTPEGKARL